MVPNVGHLPLRLFTLLSFIPFMFFSVLLLFITHLQQFVEVFDVTFLDLLRRDLRFFEMDVLVVKCLKEEKQKLLMSAVGSILSQALFKVKHSVNTYYQRVSSVITASLWAVISQFLNRQATNLTASFLSSSFFSLSF